LLDQGAYFELKRHRMMTQTPQALTTRLGYAVPRRMAAAGLEDEYRAAMAAAADAYERLAEFNPQVAGYVVPNGYNRRVLVTTNLRSAIHLLELRCAENAHFSMRRVARRMAELIQQTSPVTACLLNLPCGETWSQIEKDYFKS
jgi:thymidylate synthase ThyX